MAGWQVALYGLCPRPSPKSRNQTHHTLTIGYVVEYQTLVAAGQVIQVQGSSYVVDGVPVCVCADVCACVCVCVHTVFTSCGCGCIIFLRVVSPLAGFTIAINGLWIDRLG